MSKEENIKPKRPWFQFSLRTMFVLVTLVCVLLSWVGYSLNWIKQRREVLSRCLVAQEWLELGLDGRLHHASRSAPSFLWLFGELGYSRLTIKFGEGDFECDMEQSDIEFVARAARLFPEAKSVEGFRAVTDDPFSRSPKYTFAMPGS
jgi:hypothetical protein